MALVGIRSRTADDMVEGPPFLTVEIYRRALAIFIASYLFLLATWCGLDAHGNGRPPLLLIGAPAGLALLPPLPARELPTPPEPPLEFYSSLEAARVSGGDGTSEVVLVFSHRLNFQQEIVGAALQVTLYPLDRGSVKAQVSALREAGYSVAIEPVSRFASRLTLSAPGQLFPRLPEAGAEGRARSVVLGFRRAPDASAEADAAPATGKIVERSRREVVPGLSLRKCTWITRRGATSTMHVLELDPARANVKLALGTGSPVMRSRTRVSEMVRRTGAIAGLNAGFFAMNGNPLGVLIDRGKVICSPIYSRSSFGIYQQKRTIFGNPEFSGRIRVPGGELEVHSLNEKREDGKLVVYTPEFGESTRTSSDGLEIAVSGGKVVEVGGSDLEIPSDGIVIAAHGRRPALLASVSEGDEITFDWGVTPPWNLCDVAIGGGPRLLKDGQLDVNSREERFDKNFSGQRAPRSAFGATASGRMIFLAVDGRHPPANCGVSLQETAQIMRQLGCAQAVNLDGGGSTTMVLRDRVLNAPSDGVEREVSTAILILPADSQVASGIK